MEGVSFITCLSRVARCILGRRKADEMNELKLKMIVRNH